ncbi:hypothetical protein AB0E06_23460 [Streptomyces sp. NPDC048109]|uniref:hypothetical protein n=1 Tax=unclassified Streptomyces TaxID=2593676 RepID=UPI003407CCF0
MSTEHTRPKPKYRKEGNGYVFQHQYTDADGKSLTRSVRVSRITRTRWQSFDYYSDKQIEGTITTGRDTSACAAMDVIDRETENEQHDDTTGHDTATKSSALQVPDITGPSPLTSSSETAPAVVADVEVRPVPAPQANVLPHLRPADQAAQDEAWRRREAVEGVVVGRFANGTKGSLPKDSEHEDVKAALAVLAGTERHHMSLKLALLRDEYDEDEPSTYDVNEARGAWAAPGDHPGMVKIFALLGGKHTRWAHRYPHMTKGAAKIQEDTWTVEKKIHADRFREAGWHVKDGCATGLCVIVWRPGTRPTLPADDGRATASGQAAAGRLPEPPQTEALSRPGSSLNEHAYSGHMMLFDAAVRLEDFRRHRDRQYLAPAAHITRHAAATFKARIGDGSELTWDLVTRYLVEIRSCFYAADRDISFDPNPPAGDMFARDPATSLADLCPEGHHAVMNAARHLDYAARRNDGTAADWADRQAFLAADHFRDTLANGTRETWVMICRYAAELHAATLRARREHRTGTST